MVTKLPSDEFPGNTPVNCTHSYFWWYNLIVNASSSVVTESMRAVTPAFHIINGMVQLSTFLPHYFKKVGLVQ